MVPAVHFIYVHHKFRHLFIMVLAERTVTLLAFEDASQSPLADLMSVTQRQKTASELNAAILSSQRQVSYGEACTMPGPDQYTLQS